MISNYVDKILYENENISDNKFIPGAKGTGIPNLKRHLGAYISQRDLSQLFEKSLNKEEIIGNIEGVPFLVVYGVSNNTRRFWSLESGRKVPKLPLTGLTLPRVCR
jgi:hypothetical protein